MPYLMPWIFLLLMACSTMDSHQTESPSALKPHWMKNTYKGKIVTGTKVPHLMQPLLTADFVFQGNGKDGLVAYDKKTGQQLWRKDIEGGTNGAVFHDGLLYFGGGDGVVYAVRATTGQDVWTYDVKFEVLQPPTFHKGSLYVIAGNNTVHAFNTQTGQRKWIYTRQGTFPPLNMYGGTPPLIYKDNLLVGFSDGFLVSITQDQGILTWEKQINEHGRFKNLYISLNRDQVYVSAYEQNVSAWNAVDGSAVWVINQQGGSSPITVGQDDIFFSTSDGKVICADVRTGDVKWTHSLNNSMATQPLLLKNTLFIAQSNGPLLGLDLELGQPQISYDQVKSVLAPLNISERRLYVMSNSGRLHVLRVLFSSK